MGQCAQKCPEGSAETVTKYDMYMPNSPDGAVNTVSKVETLPALEPHQQVLYTLYVNESGLHSLRVLIFLAESQLLSRVKVVPQVQLPDKVVQEVTESFKERIEDLQQEGKTWVPCLQHAKGYEISDEDVIAYLTAEHGISNKNIVLPAFDNGVSKDYRLMEEEFLRHKYKDHKTRGSAAGKTWFMTLDQDGDGDVSLEEMIQGLALTRLMADARRGVQVSTNFDRWAVANEQVDMLVRKRPTFVNGWRLRMLLGTISDDYDKLIESADKIVQLSPTDPHALTLKCLYTKALGRSGYDEAMAKLFKSNKEIAEAVRRIINTVGKYWDTKLATEVPRGIKDNMSIVALGSPADDDGTPRPRLMGTLKKTLEAAKMYPDAHIFVTGAAVSSNMPEAIAMTKWLTKRGIDEKRITKEMKAMDTVGNYVNIEPMLRRRGVTKVMLITVYYHLNRSSALADAVFEQRGLKVQVVGVAGESDLKGADLDTRLAVEKPASYRDLARAANLFENADFDRFDHPLTPAEY